MIESLTSTLFFVVFAAVILGMLASKIVSLAIDGLIWLRTWLADVNAAVICKRAGCVKKK